MASPFGNTSFSTEIFSRLKNLPKYIEKITNISVDYNDLIDKNRIGASPRRTDIIDTTDDMGLSDILRGIENINQSNIPYFSKRYQERKRQLIRFAANPEIQFIVHSIANDAIASDEYNMFCTPVLDIPTMRTEIKEAVTSRFNKIYSYFGFNEKITPWAYMVKWLIEGYLAFEIIYDNKDNPREIIGFEERDPTTLIPLFVEQEYARDGEKKTRKVKIWKQIVKERTGKTVVKDIPDNSIVFIEYNHIPGSDGRFAYIERLIRNFNLMRVMENTRVAWNTMNAQYRIKLIIPVGTRTSGKAKQALSMVTNKYKEDLTIDHDSGEVNVNGQPLINFGKSIVLPSRNGQEPKVEGVSYSGPDLSNIEPVRHFEQKMWRDSGMPFSRFDRGKGGGTSIIFNNGTEGIPNDEKNYYKMVNRFRREFDAIIRKPLYLQLLLDFPNLKEDMEFKSKLGLSYASDDVYMQAKEEEIENHKLQRIAAYEKLTEIDGLTPIYSRKYLYVEKFKLMTEDEWDKNMKMKLQEMATIAIRQQKGMSSLPVISAANGSIVTPENTPKAQVKMPPDLSGLSNSELAKNATELANNTNNSIETVQEQLK